MLTDLQTALGEGPVIANHAYGPPHDNMVKGSVSFRYAACCCYVAAPWLLCLTCL